MAGKDIDRALIERVLARPVADATRAVWGFQNRTDIVTLGDGERVVVQRYRRREDAEYRLRVMDGLRAAAAKAGIAIPRIRTADLETDPALVIFDALPGLPLPEAGDAAPGGPLFSRMAHSMGELLGAFRALPADGLGIDDRWADPDGLTAAARQWADEMPELSKPERATLAKVVDRAPALFAGRDAVLAHGDFAPVNVLTDGSAISGLLDFESVRFADRLFDVAWWAWSVSFSSPRVLKAALPPFLDAAGIDPGEPELAERIESLQVLRMLELLAGEASLDPGIRRIVLDRLRAAAR